VAGTLTVTGSATVEFADGSASTPSITNDGDTNTGIFFPAADTIAFATAGTEAMRLDSAGNMGLGVTPSAWSGSVPRAIQVGTGSYLATNTDGTLQLGTNGFYNGSNFIYTLTGFAGRYAFSPTNGSHAWLNAASGTAGNTISFTQAMTLDASGNLGVGTTSPIQVGRLSIAYNSASQRGLVTSASLTDLTDHIGLVNPNGLVGSIATDGTSLVLQTGGAERARITSDGDLLVGTTSAVTSARAIFNRSSGANIVISQSILSNGNSTYFSAKNNDTVQRQCDIGVYKHAGITNSAGYVGYTEEEGTNQYTWVGNDGNFRISSDPGAIGTNGGTVVGTQTSDERLKNIVGGLQYGLSQILALEPIAFAMKDSPNNKKIGFSAQQVQPIIPEAVYDTGDCIDGYDADPEDKMVQTPKSDRTKLAMEYTQIVPVLVKAIQEQQALITQLQADVAALKGASA
jgi:hypothetical protein